MTFKFKRGAKQEIGTNDPWYALTGGGYLKPEEVLADKKQLKQLQDAIEIVQGFIDQCYDKGVIEEA